MTYEVEKEEISQRSKFLNHEAAILASSGSSDHDNNQSDELND